MLNRLYGVLLLTLLILALFSSCDDHQAQPIDASATADATAASATILPNTI